MHAPIIPQNTINNLFSSFLIFLKRPLLGADKNTFAHIWIFQVAVQTTTLHSKKVTCHQVSEGLELTTPDL